MYGDRVTRMLKTQYRMNQSIMTWASESLYEGQLTAHPSVSNHLLCHLVDVETNEDTGKMLTSLVSVCSRFYRRFKHHIYLYIMRIYSMNVYLKKKLYVKCIGCTYFLNRKIVDFLN